MLSGLNKVGTAEERLLGIEVRSEDLVCQILNKLWSDDSSNTRISVSSGSVMPNALPWIERPGNHMRANKVAND